MFDTCIYKQFVFAYARIIIDLLLNIRYKLFLVYVSIEEFYSQQEHQYFLIDTFFLSLVSSYYVSIGLGRNI